MHLYKHQDNKLELLFYDAEYIAVTDKAEGNKKYKNNNSIPEHNIQHTLH